MSTHPARVSKGRAGGGSTEKEVSMRRIMLLLLVLTIGCVLPVASRAGEPIKIGLTAAVSGGSAASGEAIKKGLQIAMDEINAKGLLGGRKLELVIRDDE